MRSLKFPQLICALALLVAGLVLPSVAMAQRHHPGARTHVVVGVGFPYYSPYFWGSYYGSPFWGPYGFWPPPYGYYGAYDYASDVRILATPREAEVYVDGYLVGTVDDFDGWSQRLRLQPGEHEIELYLEGHRSVRQKMLFRPSETYKIRASLEKTRRPATRRPCGPCPRQAPPRQRESPSIHRPIGRISRRRICRRDPSGTSGRWRSACSPAMPWLSWMARAGIVRTAIRGSAWS